jgi:hypothetical protein
MAATFLEFSNGILQSPLIRRDPVLMAKLQSATNSMLHLCQGGSGLLDDSPDDGQRNTSNTIAGGQPLGGSTSDDAEFQQVYHGHEEPSQAATLGNMLVDFDTFGRPAPAPQPRTITSTVQLNPFIKPESSIRNVFGNGFMNMPPIDFATCAETDSMLKTYPSEDSLCVMVTRASLQNAYDYILSDTYATSAMVDRIFGFTLKFRSREEILMVLRWYLRPQTSEIFKLATAEFDDYLVAQYYHGINTAQYTGIEGVFRGGNLDPSSNQKSSPSEQSRILNAYQIEQWFLACGMKYVDFDTIQLEDVKPLGLMLNNRPPDEPETFIQPTTPLQQHQSRQRMPLQNESMMDGQAAVGDNTNSESICKNIRISRSRLVHVLTGISFCIDKGPAYCEKALLEAVVIAMVADN